MNLRQRLIREGTSTSRGFNKTSKLKEVVDKEKTIFELLRDNEGALGEISKGMEEIGVRTLMRIRQPDGSYKIKQFGEVLSGMTDFLKKRQRGFMKKGGRVNFKNGSKPISEMTERELEMLLLLDDTSPIYMDERKREWFRRKYPMRVIGEKPTRQIQREIFENTLKNMKKGQNFIEVAQGGRVGYKGGGRVNKGGGRVNNLDIFIEEYPDGTVLYKYNSLMKALAQIVP